MSTETKKRTILKTLTSKVGEISISAIIIQVLFGKVFLSLGLPILCELVQTSWYFFHERLWAKIKWGELRDCEECPFHKKLHEKGIEH